MERWIRPLDEVKALMLERARIARNPFEATELADVERAFALVRSLDRDEWAAAISRVARPYEDRARDAEAAGDTAAAAILFRRAYGLYRVARYPAPNSTAKREAYGRYRACFLGYARYLDPPLEVVAIPFAGRPGEGREIVAHLHRRPDDHRPPVVVTWGGIDSFKEDQERARGVFLARGMALLAVDMPGVGEAPLAGSTDAERMFDAVLDWIGTRGDLDARRIAVLGRSTGGYWAAKLAHTAHERIVAAVDHGGCTHHAFAAAWIEQAQHGEYPLELAETLACAFGRSSFDEWVSYAPALSLLDLGLLDGPSAPLLLWNGVRDSVFPIADLELLLRHGAPKTARFTEGGHMGYTRETNEVIAGWLAERFAQRSR